MLALDEWRLHQTRPKPEQVRAYADDLERGQTAVDQSRSSDRLFGDAELSDLSQLTTGHSFIDGLTRLVTSAGTGDLATLTSSRHAQPPRIEITALTRAVIGRIRISGLRSGQTASLEYNLGAEFQAVDQAGARDLEQSRRVTGDTLFALASLFKEESA